MKQTCHFLIGAASSGGGKTTFTTGMLRLLHNRGLNIQPFKCGPDYIDTKYHEMASGHPSVNLDLWLSSDQHIKLLYADYAAKQDVCVTEGVMGLFDGYDGMHGSSAEIASLLDIPVILVINAQSTAYTVAPILYGFKHFNPSICLAGVVFNQVASERHYSYLLQACADVGVTSFGYLPRLKELEVPSRHLGLTLDTLSEFDQYADRIAQVIEEHIDVNRLIQTCSSALTDRPIPSKHNATTGKLRIAVARDAAFNFIYKENLSRLEEWGTVTFFSPMADAALPESDLVYLPGGYPEFFLKELEANRTLKEQLRDYVESGGRLLAECGGMMYLCDAIQDNDGKFYPMVGLLHQTATMQNMRLRLGYRSFQLNGQKWKGHEFHYSSIQDASQIPSIATLTDARGQEVATPIYRYKNMIAGYTHLYWGENDLMKLWD